MLPDASKPADEPNTSTIEMPNVHALTTLVERMVPTQGPNETPWPGLTAYRFDKPCPPHWDQVGSMSLCLVLRGRKRVVINGRELFYDPLHYLVMTRAMKLEAEILEARPDAPFLSLVLQIPPVVVAEMLGEMRGSEPAPNNRPLPPSAITDAFVAVMSDDLHQAVQRLMVSLLKPDERRVIGPLALRELIYRLIVHSQGQRMAEAAFSERSTRKVMAALNFIRCEYERQISIEDIAAAANASPSSLAHSFKEVVGVSPHHYLKKLRLEKARLLMLRDGHSVADAAQLTGHVSTPHFMREFKKYFGEPPVAYMQSMKYVAQLGLADATSPKH